MIEVLEQLWVVVQPAYRVREQACEPSRIFRLGLRHVGDTGLEVVAARVHRTDHHLVAKNELEIDAIGRNLQRATAARDAREHEHAISGERQHAVEDDSGGPGAFEDEIEWTE